MTRRLETIFCDDFREELGGKVSYMGVYGDKLYLSQFPATLQKLCLVVHAKASGEKPFTKLHLRIFKDEELLAEMVLPDQDLELLQQTKLHDPLSDTQLTAVAKFQIVMSPMSFTEPCRINIRAETEEGIIKGQGLSIELQPSPTAV